MTTPTQPQILLPNMAQTDEDHSVPMIVRMPHEVLDVIAFYVAVVMPEGGERYPAHRQSQNDLLSMSLTCKRLHQATVPTLHRHVALTSAAGVACLLRYFIEHPERRHHTRTISHYGFTSIHLGNDVAMTIWRTFIIGSQGAAHNMSASVDAYALLGACICLAPSLRIFYVDGGYATTHLREIRNLKHCFQAGASMRIIYKTLGNIGIPWQEIIVDMDPGKPMYARWLEAKANGHYTKELWIAPCHELREAWPLGETN